ncbi:hypothetical protein [Undibacterium squillarum]|uniref:hypothetical protein n=1 Tax=Undibacterium squillarum TaxID=1131567 RepID=UPI001675A9C8|nr:hypothetical protein [Undibacterium squillarum]
MHRLNRYSCCFDHANQFVCDGWCLLLAGAVVTALALASKNAGKCRKCGVQHSDLPVVGRKSGCPEMADAEFCTIAQMKSGGSGRCQAASAVRNIGATGKRCGRIKTKNGELLSQFTVFLCRRGLTAAAHHFKKLCIVFG